MKVSLLVSYSKLRVPCCATGSSVTHEFTLRGIVLAYLTWFLLLAAGLIMFFPVVPFWEEERGGVTDFSAPELFGALAGENY